MTTFVRPARAEDKEKFLEWYKNCTNSDPSSFNLPDTYILCAFKDKIIGFLPIQALSFTSSQVLDSMVLNPEATNIEIASAMREFVKHAITIGYLKDCYEIYFIGDHPETNAVAERIFEKVKYPVYRLDLRDLEPKE